MLLGILLSLLGGISYSWGRLPLVEVQGRAICPFRYRQDIDEHRVPAVIEKVECEQRSKQDQITYVDSEGRFNRTCTCTEILTELTVEYRRATKDRRVDKVTYPVGCMCINDSSHSPRAVDKNTVQ